MINGDINYNFNVTSNNDIQLISWFTYIIFNKISQFPATTSKNVILPKKNCCFNIISLFICIFHANCTIYINNMKGS